jgi:glycosyltransferase involved in cell wall biosynthesis
MSGVPVLEALLDAMDALDDTRLRVDVHRDVVESSGARHDPALVPALQRARDRGAQVEVHDYFDDNALWDYLEDLDASVLPYRYGTHSGWLEACRDLGTAVIAPDCGYYAEQGPVHSFHLSESGLDAASLVDAVRQAQTAGRPTPIPVNLREEQRRKLANAHAEIYAELMQ